MFVGKDENKLKRGRRWPILKLCYAEIKYCDCLKQVTWPWVSSESDQFHCTIAISYATAKIVYDIVSKFPHLHCFPIKPFNSTKS